MTRQELCDLIENRNKTISMLSEKDRYKVAELIKDTVDKFLSLDSSDFNDVELAKIFEISKDYISSHAMLDYEKLMSGEKTYVTNMLYPQVLFSLRNMQLSLRIYPENTM